MTEVAAGDGGDSETATHQPTSEDPLHARLRWVLQRRAEQVSRDRERPLAWDDAAVREQLAADIGMTERRLRDWLRGDYPDRGRKSAQLDRLQEVSERLPGYPPSSDRRTAHQIARARRAGRTRAAAAPSKLDAEPGPAGRSDPADPDAGPGPDPGPRTDAGASRWRVPAYAVTTLALLLVAVLTSVAWTRHHDATPDLQVRIDAPAAGSEVGFGVPFHGTVAGALPSGHTLWATEQSADEQYLHPLDHPCPIVAGRWRCDDLYLGRDTDVGREFVVSMIDADAAATAYLERYGSRNHDAADAYVGVASLPSGAVVVATSTVTRR